MPSQLTSPSPTPATPQPRVPLVTALEDTLTLWTTPETWASPQPCLTCKAPTKSGHFWPPKVMLPGLVPAAPVISVPPPEPPSPPGLSAEIVAEKPPPNEAV